uniref:Odorant receptor n=1 Tax=Phlebotomus papatasi TaxID=29031 RepID=A0A240SY88_PHLPP
MKKFFLNILMKNPSCESFFRIFKFCVTSRILQKLHGEPRYGAIFIILTVYSIFFCYCVIKNFIEILSDKDIETLQIIFTILMFLGYGQLLLKNFAGAPFYREFQSLVDFIETLHSTKEDNIVVQEIVSEEIAKAMKYSLLFFKLYNNLGTFSVIAFIGTITWKDYTIISIPVLHSTEYRFIYHSIQNMTLVIAALWNGLSDTAIVIIGLYIVHFLKVINKMIKSLDNVDKVKQCPDLLIHILKKHLKIIKILRTFNESVKFMSFVQLFMSTILFLTMIATMQLYKTDVSIECIFATLITQLTFLCLFGEQIRSETVAVFNNLYLTNWYKMSLSHQKFLLIMMINARKEIGLKAAGMGSFSVFAHTLALNNSYSSYTP